MLGERELTAVRKDFPALEQEIHGCPLAYLDNASTTLKPKPVIDAIRQIYSQDCANVHRGVHTLAHRATERFEATRAKVARYLGGVDPKEVIFVRGTTEAINLVAQSLGPRVVGEGDEVLVSELEHHSNLVPWQMLCEARGARLQILPIDHRGRLKLEALPRVLGPRTRVVALSQASNSLGTVNDVRQVADAARKVAAILVVDGAQAAPHRPVSVRELGADFYAFSSHKVYGPGGAGVLWGREALLKTMPPWQGGGDMIASVSLRDGIEYADIPYKFEAGTPDIASIVGFGAALDWVEQIGMPAIMAHERALLQAVREGLEAVPGVTLVGTAPDKVAVVSFVMEGVHPHDAGTILDTLGIAVRTGHHCAEPVMEHFGIPGTIRASFGIYNTLGEVERLLLGVAKVRNMFELRS